MFMDFDNLSEVLPESSKATEERRLDDNKLRSGDGPRRIQVAPPAPTPTPTQPPTEIGTPAPSGGTGMGGLLLEPLRYWSPFLAAQTDWDEWKSVACSVYKVSENVKKLPWYGNYSASCVRECTPARQRFAEHFHTLEWGHRPSQTLNSSDQISAPLY